MVRYWWSPDIYGSAQLLLRRRLIGRDGRPRPPAPTVSNGCRADTEDLEINYA